MPFRFLTAVPPLLLIAGAAAAQSNKYVVCSARNKEKLATALQVAIPRYRNLVARVTFGHSPSAGPGEVQALGASVAAQMHHLIFEDGSAQHTAESLRPLILSRN